MQTQPEEQTLQEEQEQPQSLMSILCKVAFTSTTTVVTLPFTTTIEELIHYVNNNLKYSLHIHDRYQIEVVETYKNEHLPTELGAKLEPSNQTIFERYGTPMTVTAFYLRPVDPAVGSFVIQSTYDT
jgi:hypothetical protein